ncbi:hypothetical protein TNCV_5037621 [Trichonephila clavipes]|nr:hypothetical protein TNCV_5037621 [Trichonephila clavipes]
MTNIELRNIIIGSKDYEEEFVRDQLSVILEERFERKVRKNRQAARNRGEKSPGSTQSRQLRWESELNELRIGRAEEYVRETSPAALMAEATIPATTPIKEEKGMDDLRAVSRQG